MSPPKQQPVEFVGSVPWVQYVRFNAKTPVAIPWARGVFFGDTGGAVRA